MMSYRSSGNSPRWRATQPKKRQALCKDRYCALANSTKAALAQLGIISIVGRAAFWMKSCTRCDPIDCTSCGS